MAMRGRSESDKPAQRWAFVVTILLHACVLGGLVFLVAWREPDPPLPQVGIELNFGLSQDGSGDIQPEPEPEAAPEQPAPEPEPVTPPVQQEEVPQQNVKTETVPVPEKSPVVVQQKPVEEKVTPDKAEPQKAPVKPQEKKQDPKLVYNSQQSTTSKDKSGGEGETAGKTSDQGKPEGKVDAKALYDGKVGGGGGSGNGSGLDLAGWKWEREPRPKLSDQEKSGKVVFEITIDADGTIVGLKVIERSISIEAARICEEEIHRLNFIQVSDRVPEFSKGKITIYVSAQ